MAASQANRAAMAASQVTHGKTVKAWWFPNKTFKLGNTNGAHLLTTRAAIKGGKPYSAERWNQSQLAAPATIEGITTRWSH